MSGTSHSIQALVDPWLLMFKRIATRLGPVSAGGSQLKASGIPQTGCSSHGGNICTAGGLVFMSGTFDRVFRAYESDSGRVAWERHLVSAGFATPCSYEANGKQYIVVAACGGKEGSPASDEFIAFSL